jgi:hypothetical protein
MVGEIAECGPEGTQAIGTDIWKVFEAISMSGILSFFLHCENCKYLKYF